MAQLIGFSVLLTGFLLASIFYARRARVLARELGYTKQLLLSAQRMAAFGALGAGITHEVKNPVTALIGFAQVAQRKLDDPAQALELLKTIESEGLRCRDILANFLAFARGQAQEMRRVRLNLLVEEAARVLRHQLVVHKTQLELRLAPEDPWIMASEVELQQLVVNLAQNAQQSMTEGGKVELTTLVVGNEVVLAVADDGPGIAEEHLGEIFDPFFTTKTDAGGTGLGLYVCKQIAARHKGDLRVISAVGRGATFELHVPLAPAQAPV